MDFRLLGAILAFWAVGGCGYEEDVPPDDVEYGTTLGEIMEPFCLEDCVCNGAQPTGGQELCLEDFMADKKAVLINVHTGW